MPEAHVSPAPSPLLDSKINEEEEYQKSLEVQCDNGTTGILWNVTSKRGSGLYLVPRLSVAIEAFFLCPRVTDSARYSTMVPIRGPQDMQNSLPMRWSET